LSAWLVRLLIEKEITMFRKKEKHKCDYKVLGSKNERMTSKAGHERDYTHVMFQCECGDWYMSEIIGKWTEEEVKRLK